MIDTTCKAPAIKAHTVSRKIETEADWKEAQEKASEVVEWFNTSNGNFAGTYEHGYAMHHAQVDPEGKPLNFFVLDKDMTLMKSEKDADGKEKEEVDIKKRDLRTRIFPAQVIYNPEIITALQTFLDRLPLKKDKLHTVAAPNVFHYNEGCMSYQNRKPKKVARFYKIKVRYQFIDEKGDVQNVEEWIEALKAHIFQHEVDHANGIDIAHGNADGKHPTIEEREIEDGYTRAQVESFTYETIAKLEKAVAEKGECLLLHFETDTLYRAPTTLKSLPVGFIEPDVIEYYNMDGTIKPPHDKAPMYTEAPKDEQATPKGKKVARQRSDRTKGDRKKTGI